MHLQRVDDLLSVSADGPEHAQAIAAHLLDSGNWIEVVAGIDSVVVRFDAAIVDGTVAESLLSDSLSGELEPVTRSRDVVEIPVVYGGEYGPDLEGLCRDLGLSQDEFIELHAGREYCVDMVGFTPGFAFVGGLDERLRVPRRDKPRQRVAAGSIGIADGRTGMYAVASPGGWNIVGRTPFRLFDAAAADAFPVRAGMRVRYRAIPDAEFET